MKKLFLLACRVRLWLMAFAAMILLTACSSQKTYDINYNNVSYTVDAQVQTISDGTNLYSYEIIRNPSGYSLNITYPDGAVYWSEVTQGQDTSSAVGGWNNLPAGENYTSSNDLTSILEATVLPQASSHNIVLIVLLIIIGLLCIIFPRAFWYLERGWHFKDAEPSDLSLVINRCIGVLALIIAIVMIFS